MSSLTICSTYVLWTASTYCHQGPAGSRFGKRLDRSVHKEMTIKLRLFPGALALHRKQTRRERLRHFTARLAISPMTSESCSVPDLRLAAIPLGPLRLWVIFSPSPNFLQSVMQEIGATPF
jgi:hypothetical protein